RRPAGIDAASGRDRGDAARHHRRPAAQSAEPAQRLRLPRSLQLRLRGLRGRAPAADGIRARAEQGMPSAAPVAASREAPAKGGAPLLTVQDLKVYFEIGGNKLLGKPPGVVKAVDGVSFELRPGETLGLVGESGCGKSTLGRAVLRLLPIHSGRVVWLGQDLAKLEGNDMRAVRRDMQIIFQDPLASLNPRMTVGEIIAEPLQTFQPQ